MSDWNPQVVRIEKIEKHPGADRLIVVTVLGDYPVITNMTSLQVNDLIGYLPIDTIVPSTEDFHFLSPMEYEKYEDENGEVQHECPKCKEGKLVLRKSVYGRFYGCSRFPKCRYIAKVE